MHKSSVSNIFTTSCPAARRAYTDLSMARQQLLALSCTSHPAADPCHHTRDTSPATTGRPSTRRDTRALSRGTDSHQLPGSRSARARQPCPPQQSPAATSPEQGHGSRCRHHGKAAVPAGSVRLPAQQRAVTPGADENLGTYKQTNKQTPRIRIHQQPQ